MVCHTGRLVTEVTAYMFAASLLLAWFSWSGNLHLSNAGRVSFQ